MHIRIKSKIWLSINRIFDTERLKSFIERAGHHLLSFPLTMFQNFYCIIQRISYNQNNGAPFGVHRCLHKVYLIHFACKLINLLEIFIYCCAKGYVPICFQKFNYSVVG